MSDALKALQSKIGAHADGAFGPMTAKAITNHYVLNAERGAHFLQHLFLKFLVNTLIARVMQRHALETHRRLLIACTVNVWVTKGKATYGAVGASYSVLARTITHSLQPT